MSKLKTMIVLLKTDRRKFIEAIMDNFARMKVSHIIPDKVYISLRYRAIFGQKLCWDSPKTFNEKLNWLKVYNKKSVYTSMVDKISAKSIVEDRIGAKYVIPTLAVWRSSEEIDFDILPESFVLKCNHDSGSTIVCSNRAEFDFAKTKNKLGKQLKQNLFWWGREWPYKDVIPHIFAEEYKKDGDNDNLPVYKFLCFNGLPRIIQTIQNDKHPNETIDYFDSQWNLLNIKQNFPNSPKPLKKPDRLDEMLEIARKLAYGTIFVRVDLFSANNKIFFSEYTFFSDCGFARFEPKEWDQILGDWIRIPNNE